MGKINKLLRAENEIEALIEQRNELLEALREAQLFIGGLPYTETPCPPDLWEKMKSAVATVEVETVK